jgi:solute carrier family 35 (UDP-xylose/UDP-N-acetylglucosamine transporter), member B4
VVIVTIGVGLTTVSNRPNRRDDSIQQMISGSTEYVIGIAILAGALVLSSAMGLAQDEAYRIYGRGHWEEGMFYLHFLSLPMFLPLAQDIVDQVRIMNASPPVRLYPTSFWAASELEEKGALKLPHIPIFWIPLILNVLTQLVCVSGVHRLTAKVSSLTVTLVLAVRKAVSLVLSVIVMSHNSGDKWLWTGSALVLAGTVLYTWDGSLSQKKRQKESKTD